MNANMNRVRKIELSMLPRFRAIEPSDLYVLTIAVALGGGDANDPRIWERLGRLTGRSTENCGDWMTGAPDDLARQADPEGWFAELAMLTGFSVSQLRHEAARIIAG